MPGVRPGHLLIATSYSLISAGTERMLVDFGKAGWIDKARQQPEKVKQVLDKIKTDGLIPTVEAVFNKLDEPMPLGYCNAGVVLEVGAGMTDFQPGDRVASNGPHAEVVSVPRNLCAKIPEGVTDEDAAFTVLGAIALQGVRLAKPTFGERFIVFGLGLVGLMTVQFLRASGCSVLAVDISESRLQLAAGYGAETVNLAMGANPIAAAEAWTGGKGVDGALIAASAKGDDIVHQAAQVCRKRGRIILVGVVDLNLRRSDFYEKELTFQVSCSYGPGRYDEKYEQGGQDYPLGFVRWTEQRNFEAVLEAMRSGRLRVTELITHRISLNDAAAGAYEKLLHNPEALGIIIEYPQNTGIEVQGKHQLKERQVTFSQEIPSDKDMRIEGEQKIRVGVIGAGNYARSTLLPALSKTEASLLTIADINPVASAHAARKFKFKKATSDYKEILSDPGINTVFILVGHNLHALFVCEALKAGKHVFVEKPLCINEKELNEIASLYPAPVTHYSSPPQLMVGFNRRFSPHTRKIQELLVGRMEPLTMTMTVNAGFIPPEHWTQDPERGGGRIIGEGCHFIDLLSFLAGAQVTTVAAAMVGGEIPVREDRMSILLTFADGSVGTVHYFANGAKSYPKETLEVFSSGRVIRMENFLVTEGYGFGKFRSFRTWRQDKGHRAEIAAFVRAVAAGELPLIPFEQIVNVTRASFAAVEAAKTGKVITL